MSASAILTAAGESSRMGSPKPLLPWPSGTGGDVPLIQYQVSQLTCAGIEEIIVVLGCRADEVSPLVAGSAGVKPVVNRQYASGKTTSIRAGLAAVSADADAIILLAVDQPRSARLIRRVLGEHRASGAAVTTPRHGGSGGHPIAFAASLRSELGRITEEGEGIREVIRRHSADIHRVHVADPAVLIDLNSPEDYRAGYERASSAPGGD